MYNCFLKHSTNLLYLNMRGTYLSGCETGETYFVWIIKLSIMAFSRGPLIYYAFHYAYDKVVGQVSKFQLRLSLANQR